ncbi:putative tubulin polyglutamylase ttll2 [Saguinus oedipus]|uniref:Tubulin polyglutamylase ttll2 n=1 Tax=Saguinus oedipus TaxID=9490 RepID=A0ABQ9W1Q2_SAGOE|nr:putative tubulin polyglutamylase ttll2 [Saguinus oedipus]KAK2114720.1 putative tubulin polyglutamylase ttll2 [Saguinus oedipus]
MAEDEPSGAVSKPLVFRVDETTPGVVQSVLLERGWNQFDEQEQNVEDWNLYWRTSSFRMTEHISVKPWQRLNHHPGTTKLTRKDSLAKHLKHMGRTCGTSLYQFTPPTFVMPGDYTKFVAEYFQERQTAGAKHSYWICKPAESSRGRGILIFSDFKDFIFDDTYIVQKYVSNPFLIGGYKSDLRIYVCVTGFKPLTIYVYEEGLVRFATEKFDLSNLQNDYAHLTNSSINKSGASYGKIKEGVGHGCKWTLSRFFSYLRSWDVDDLLLWQKIQRVVILTILAIAPSVPFAVNCFELFGFDILIDENLKPWLLEVNYSPALTLDCSTDVLVKRKLIHDIIDLIYLHGLRNEGREGSKATHGNSNIDATKSDRGVLDAHDCLPYESLSFTGRTYNVDDSVVEKAVSLCPEAAPASQLEGEVSGQEDFHLSTRETPQSKPTLRRRHTPHKTLMPYASLVQSHSCKTKTSPPVLSDHGKAPDPRAGNFVLVFPFNEATLGASRNGLNVKRIIRELRKLMNKQHSQVVRNKTQTSDTDF